jgi:hypothetical protein
MAWFMSMPSTDPPGADPSGQPPYFVAHAAADFQEALPGARAEEIGHAPLDRLDLRQPVHPRQEGEQPVAAGISIGPLEARMQVRHGIHPSFRNETVPSRVRRAAGSIHPRFLGEGTRRG